MVNQRNVGRWVRALRSGRYRQARGQLVHREGRQFSYCALGVALKAAGHKAERFGDGSGWRLGGGVCLPTDSLAEWLGVPYRYCDVFIDVPTELMERDTGCRMYGSVAYLNDTCGLTLPQIGDLIARFGLRS